MPSVSLAAFSLEGYVRLAEQRWVNKRGRGQDTLVLWIESLSSIPLLIASVGSDFFDAELKNADVIDSLKCTKWMRAGRNLKT